MTETIVVAGSLAQRPGNGGHSFVFLHYLLGLKRLGWDVLFLDRLEPEMCVDAAGRSCSLDQSENLRYVQHVMERFGLSDDYSLSYNRNQQVIGVPLDEVLERTRQAALLINVMGFLDDEDILGAARKRVFLDIDPGFGQMWRSLGLHDPFAGHDAFVTVGQNIGQPGCTIPDCGLSWIPTFPPVVLDLWPASAGDSGCFTSVASWRGAYGPIEYAGATYGLRVHEFRRFVGLPLRCRQRFELALNIHPADAADSTLLTDNGWGLVDPSSVAGDPSAYRRYIMASRAEFMVAKNMYVQSRSGWFSDRSACYLAAGKPVLAQDTGLESVLPAGEGLITFSTTDEVLAGVDAINSDYATHCRGARALAEEYLDSDVVLRRLLEQLGVS
jgi:hypothetical protein